MIETHPAHCLKRDRIKETELLGEFVPFLHRNITIQSSYCFDSAFVFFFHIDPLFWEIIRNKLNRINYLLLYHSVCA